MLLAVKEISGHDVGDDPIVFWHAWLGHWTGAQPRDMDSMLVSRYVEAYDWVKGQTPSA